MTHPSSIQTENALPNGYEGYLWRPYTRDDMQAIADLLYDDDAAGGITNYRMEADDLLSEYFDGKFNVDTSSRLLQSPDGRVVARVEIYDQAEPPVSTNISLSIAPDHVGKGLEEFCFAWGRQRAEQAIERCPDDARVVLRCWVPHGHANKEAAFKAAGYEVVRHFFRMKVDMTERPTVPALSEGFYLRTLRLPDDYDGYVTARIDAWRDHWGYTEQPYEKVMEQFRTWFETDTKFAPERVFLIIDSATEEIAAFCNSRIEEWGDPTVGYVATLLTRRAYRKRGFANFLLRHTFAYYWDLGKPSVALHVDAASLTGALKLYEDAGMHTDMIETVYELELRPGRDLTRR